MSLQEILFNTTINSGALCGYHKKLGEMSLNVAKKSIILYKDQTDHPTNTLAIRHFLSSI